MSLSGQYDQRRGIITDLLHLLVTSEDPSYYIKSFEHLAAWVDNSLDQYKVPTWLILRVCSRAQLPVAILCRITTMWRAVQTPVLPLPLQGQHEKPGMVLHLILPCVVDYQG